MSMIIAFTGSLVLALMFFLLKSLTVGILAVVSAVLWALVQKRVFSYSTQILLWPGVFLVKCLKNYFCR